MQRNYILGNNKLKCFFSFWVQVFETNNKIGLPCSKNSIFIHLDVFKS